MKYETSYKVALRGQNFAHLEITTEKKCLSLEIDAGLDKPQQVTLDWEQSVRLVKDLRNFIDTLPRPAGRLKKEGGNHNG